MGTRAPRVCNNQLCARLLLSLIVPGLHLGACPGRERDRRAEKRDPYVTWRIAERNLPGEPISGRASNRRRPVCKPVLTKVP